MTVGVEQSRITTIEQLEALYGEPSQASRVKEVSWITPHYRAMIEASPFAVLGTSGPEGLDCSPRGDLPGFVRVADDKTLLLPDRRGNNRADSLRNIIRDPRVALLFFLPGLDYTLRVNGRAYLSTDSGLLQSFVMEGKAPRCVVVIEADAVFFQCARALLRSDLWNSAKHLDPSQLPTSGQILAALSNGTCGGEAYDKDWPTRARKSLW
ncbi:MAG: pyridoxamine 5'-phosphate oxidase family protein [Chloroflexi bacterium]|nr:pyridoxamine 5'-phosphate oxidase family protein [Chloroflexota bacterium]MBV9600482.1 pyridoxamine 5'-phosphate oxidase family protein [Chloroflexota bacterium]